MWRRGGEQKGFGGACARRSSFRSLCCRRRTEPSFAQSLVSRFGFVVVICTHKPALRKTISPPLCLHKTKKKNRERDAHTPPAVAARAVASQRPVPPHPSPHAAGTTPPPAAALPPSTRAAPSPPAHAAARSCLVQQQRLVLGARPEIIVVSYRVGASHCARVPRRIPPEVQTRAWFCRPAEKDFGSRNQNIGGHVYRRCCGRPRRGCGS